jgi:hypothetical protein
VSCVYVATLLQKGYIGGTPFIVFCCGYCIGVAIIFGKSVAFVAVLCVKIWGYCVVVLLWPLSVESKKCL